ncbi:uncharacterized protein Z520_05223 [Fonsecaea multimorphosa CBS 102226]|uniref:DUF202 domain-containing protein n=1 Tax=Fonsecaea multimorphosa CBS 102226 TaxID=1442371 RepID=A0A0D2JZ14_9EURO|nr:uncharacterized protein Z520_05223 [Fonsecaea multimorphosa CBS 102226]KIX98762.1 hypothetical protein Z520_05223 [Fonsecaea multimorphosa CBS 102226]OAL25044.1 hypothetical protein AYO22_04921 [Fonsecaea multimorphosa]
MAMAIRRRFRSSSTVLEMNGERYTTSIHQSYPVSPGLTSSAPSTLGTTSDYVEMARQFWDGLEQTSSETGKMGQLGESWSLRKFWDEYVAVEMEFGYNVRDHVTNEETFIGWFDLGLGMASFGLVVLQFGILNGRLIDSPHATRLGKAMACISFILAILCVVVGAYRFFRQQKALVQGQICIGGLSMFSAVSLYIMVLVASIIISWIDVL